MKRSIACLALTLAACGPTAASPSPPPPPLLVPIAHADVPPKVQDATSVRLQKGISPLRYDLSLRVDPRQATFSGKARIDIALEAPSDAIVLHARAMTIDGATVDGAKVMVTPRRAFGARQDPEEIVLSPGKALPAGEHAVTIEYTAPFNGQLKGLYKVQQGGKAWAFTQLEAVDARRMFPGFDEPRFKTPFTLHVEVPDGMLAVSNAPLSGTRKSGATTTFDFAPTLPLPTYLVALAVGDLEITEGPKDPVPIRIVTVPGKGKLGGLALEAASAYLKILGAYFDRAYPYPKLDIAAVPDFGPGAMENAGLVTFREELLLIDDKRAPIGARRRMESVMAHELAHQWFGDLVTMQWWDDIWLNEGFATWMAAKAVDVRRPDAHALTDGIGGKLSVMSSDALDSARPVRITVEASDMIREASGWTAYTKGQSVLRMLETHVGVDAFRDGIRGYVKGHAWGTVTSDDLIASLAKATGKDLAPIAHAFLDQPGVPIVNIELACDQKGARAHLTAGPLAASADASKQKERKWPIPVCLKVDGAKEPICTRLEGAADLTFPKCPAWIEPNAGENGYYRYALSSAMLRALAKSAPRSLDEAERGALISNLWALVQASLLDAGDALDLVVAMDPGHDPSRLVIEQTISMLGAARAALVDDASLPKFRALVSRLLSPTLERLGDDPRPGDAEDARVTRVAVTAALFDLGDDARVKATAEKRVRAWLKDPTSVDPDLASLALRISSRARGAATPEALYERLARAEPSDRVALVSALGSSGDPAVLKKAMADVVSGVIRAGDFRYLHTAAGRQPEARKIFIDWTMEHIEELGKKLGGVGGLAGLIGWTCDAAENQRVSAFWKQQLSRLEGGQRSFEEGTEVSALCIRLRERQRDKLSRWLAK